MQPVVVGNFRARLRKCGYSCISISRMENGFWHVSAIEPLGGFEIDVVMSFSDMFSWR